MAEQLYNIVFKGETLDGVDQTTAQDNLAKLFKLPADKIGTQFFSQPCYLKKSLDKDTAAKYQAALKKAGLKIYIKAQKPEAEPQTSTAAENPITSQAPVEQNAPQQEDQQETQQEEPYGLSLAPMEGNLLKQTEQKASVISELDLSAYSLAAQDGYLVDPQELPPRDYPLIEIPDLELVPLS